MQGPSTLHINLDIANGYDLRVFHHPWEIPSYGATQTTDLDINSTPEPATLSLLVIGAVGMLRRNRRA